jgi:hypothetical protein
MSHPRQHYAEANAKRPIIPTWLALLVIIACIGLGGIAS